MNKGARVPNATTAIVTGTILAIGNSPVRTHFTDGAVKTIVEAVTNPDVGSCPDLTCEEFAEACEGNFDGDGDCDGTDAALFKLDFGRSSFSNPFPFCVVGDWCVYP